VCRTGRDWLPIRITSNQAGVSVTWLRFGNKRLEEPFWPETIRALREQRPPAEMAVTGPEVLVARATTVPTAAPSGIIFHVSRCGSTLVAAAVQAAIGFVVLSEAEPLYQLFLPGLLKEWPVPRSKPSRARRALIDAVISLYGAAFETPPQTVVIKCHAYSLLQIDAMRRAWPSVPCVIVIRDPLEVLVSNHYSPGSWVSARYLARGERSFFGWKADDVHRMSEEEYISRGLGRFFETAEASVDDTCRILDYADIDRSVLGAVTAFLGVPPGSLTPDVLATVLQRYSKDVTGSQAFVSDIETKRSAATPQMRLAVDRWCGSPYTRLWRRRYWQRRTT
jgi:hypothetical protein